MELDGEVEEGRAEGWEGMVLVFEMVDAIGWLLAMVVAVGDWRCS